MVKSYACETASTPGFRLNSADYFIKLQGENRNILCFYEIFDLLDFHWQDISIGAYSLLSYTISILFQKISQGL